MESKRERKRLWWAILGSIFVHLLVAFSLAAFSQMSGPVLPPEEKPLELTMMDLSAAPTPSVPINPPFIENDPEKESAEEPKEKTFESNANSLAKSNSAASGDAPLPSQEGKERPMLNMQTQASSLAARGATPQPTPPPVATPLPTATPATPPPTATPATPPPTQTPRPRPSDPPKPTPLPEPIATPQPDQLAMLTSTPPPAIRDPNEVDATPPPEVQPTVPPPALRPLPERPATAYQPEKQETRITGRITDRGASSVNAVATPLGRYQKLVTDAIGSRWYYYTKSKMDLVSIGTAQVEAQVDAKGKVQKLRLISNDANEAFANICLQSFQEAQIPPIPPELVATLPDGRLQVSFSFTMYAN